MDRFNIKKLIVAVSTLALIGSVIAGDFLFACSFLLVLLSAISEKTNG